MPQTADVRINGKEFTVAEGTSVAAAVLNAGYSMRTSIHGEPRAALCGMGICYECRVTIDGCQHRKSCQVLCATGMEIETT